MNYGRMRTLRVINLILSLIVSASLLFCGAIVLALSKYVAGLFWLAMLCFFLGAWGSR